MGVIDLLHRNQSENILGLHGLLSKRYNLEDASKILSNLRLSCELANQDEQSNSKYTLFLNHISEKYQLENLKTEDVIQFDFWENVFQDYLSIMEDNSLSSMVIGLYCFSFSDGKLIDVSTLFSEDGFGDVEQYLTIYFLNMMYHDAFKVQKTLNLSMFEHDDFDEFEDGDENFILSSALLLPIKFGLVEVFYNNQKIKEYNDLDEDIWLTLFNEEADEYPLEVKLSTAGKIHMTLLNHNSELLKITKSFHQYLKDCYLNQ